MNAAAFALSRDPTATTACETSVTSGRMKARSLQNSDEIHPHPMMLVCEYVRRMGGKAGGEPDSPPLGDKRLRWRVCDGHDMGRGSIGQNETRSCGLWAIHGDNNTFCSYGGQ